MKKSEFNSMKSAKVRRMFFWALAMLAVISIFLLLAFGWLVFGPAPPPRTITSIKSQACAVLIKANCNISSYSIQIKNFDANKNGETNDVEDTLQALCENYYGASVGSQSHCKKICGCT